MTDIADNLETVHGRVAEAARAAGRDPEEITVIAVSKMKPRKDVEAALAAGHADFGENKVQEAENKYATPLENARLHMIGHLQSNKTRNAAALFDRIHTLDKAKTIRRLDRHLQEAEREMAALIQVDIAGEDQKSGCPPARVPELLKVFSECSALKLDGLMIIPPFSDDPEEMRPWFRKLRTLRDRLEQEHPGLELPHLSMGMSMDYDIAIAEGATMVRIGTAIFGERDYGQG